MSTLKDHHFFLLEQQPYSINNNILGKKLDYTKNVDAFWVTDSVFNKIIRLGVLFIENVPVVKLQTYRASGQQQRPMLVNGDA